MKILAKIERGHTAFIGGMPSLCTVYDVILDYSKETNKVSFVLQNGVRLSSHMNTLM